MNKKKIKKAISIVSKHPVVNGAVAGITNAVFASKGLSSNDSTFEYSCLAYLFSSAVNNYINNGFMPDSRTLTGKLDDAICKNKEIIAFSAGIAFREAYMEYLGYYFPILSNCMDSVPNCPLKGTGLSSESQFLAGALIAEIALATRKHTRHIHIPSEESKGYSLAQKLKGFIFENPILFSAPFASWQFYDTHNYFSRIIKADSEASSLALSAFYGLAAGLAVHLSIRFAGSILHTNSLKRISPNTTLEEKVCLTHEPVLKARALSRLAYQSHLRGNLREALKCYRFSLKMSRAEKTAEAPLDFPLGAIHFNSIASSLETIAFKLSTDKNIVETIRQINNYALNRKIPDALALANSLISSNPENDMILAYCASLNDFAGESSLIEWAQLIQKIIDEEGIISKKQEGRDSTIITIEHPLLENSIIIKKPNTAEADKKLYDEFDKTSWVYKLYGDDTKVTKPIGILKNRKNEKVFVMEHANARPLEESENTDVVEKAIESLLEFHARASGSSSTISLEKINYKAELLKSLSRLGVESILPPALLENYLQLTEKLPCGHVIHNDLHPRNVLYNEDIGLCCIIDFQYLCNGPVNIDLSSLLDSSMLRLKDRERYYLIYHSNMGKKHPYGLFYEEQLLASVHKNIRMCATVYAREKNQLLQAEAEENRAAKYHYLRNLSNLVKSLSELDSQDNTRKLIAFVHYIVAYKASQSQLSL